MPVSNSPFDPLLYNVLNKNQLILFQYKGSYGPHRPLSLHNGVSRGHYLYINAEMLFLKVLRASFGFNLIT